MRLFRYSDYGVNKSSDIAKINQEGGKGKTEQEPLADLGNLYAYSIRHYDAHVDLFVEKTG